MLTDLNSLLDEHVKILRDVRGKSVGLQKTNNLLSSDSLDLGNAIGVTKNDTNLGGSQTLLGQLAHMFLHICSRDLEPGWWRPFVWQSTLGNTLTWTMQTTHSTTQVQYKTYGTTQHTSHTCNAQQQVRQTNTKNDKSKFQNRHESTWTGFQLTNYTLHNSSNPYSTPQYGTVNISMLHHQHNVVACGNMNRIIMIF